MTRRGPYSVDRPATRSAWRARLHEVIFEADTPAGRAFDVGLLIAIFTSVLAVMLESVADIRRDYGVVLRAVEWTLTVLFTIEYALRVVSVDRPWRYARSFFGVVDLLAMFSGGEVLGQGGEVGRRSRRRLPVLPDACYRSVELPGALVLRLNAHGGEQLLHARILNRGQVTIGIHAQNDQIEHGLSLVFGESFDVHVPFVSVHEVSDVGRE